ncbi:MAG TPA: DUF5652 family protein [Candidatus Absconditabacterales bacterium]|nr:DUF5652 family protein [Candidatus Absconditabacterales bacterium]
MTLDASLTSSLDTQTLLANMIILGFIIIAVIWEMIWKAIALWKSGRNNQLARFVCIFIFNTLGILPIIYLIINAVKKNKNKNK